MKKILAHYKGIVIAFLMLVFIIPIFINWLFKIPARCSFFAAEWEAGDVLSFYGAIVGSIATIIGVHLSIKYAQQNYREDEANKVRPYIALSYYLVKSRYDFLNPDDNSDKSDERNVSNSYAEFRPDKLYIVLEPNEVKYKNELVEKQFNLLKMGGLRYEACQCGEVLTPVDFISLPCVAENVGNGAALDLRIGFYKESDNPTVVYMSTLQSTKSIYLHIFSDNIEKDLYSKYILEFQYSDLIGNRYSQKFTVDLYYDDSQQQSMASVDLIGTQKRIETEDTNRQSEK